MSKDHGVLGAPSPSRVTNTPREVLSSGDSGSAMQGGYNTAKYAPVRSQFWRRFDYNAVRSEEPDARKRRRGMVMAGADDPGVDRGEEHLVCLLRR